MSRSVLYTSSPLLASKTPVWRSKFIVAAIALGFVGLAGRAAWVQVFGNDFFQLLHSSRLFADEMFDNTTIASDDEKLRNRRRAGSVFRAF